MATLAPTPNLGLVLAQPNTNEPFSTAKVNELFTKIDAGVGQDRVRLNSAESKIGSLEGTRSTHLQGTSAQPGLVIAGTEAQRNAYWGSPGSAAQRVALAAKGARWFNTQKGWEEQYYAAYNDSGSGVFAKEKAGWAPAAHLGQVPLTEFTVSGNNLSQRGGMVVVTGNCPSIGFNNAFLTDFQAFEILIESAGLTGAAAIQMQLRNGTVNDAATAYEQIVLESSSTTTTTGTSLNRTNWSCGRQGTQSGRIQISITNPTDSGWTNVSSSSYDSDRYMRTMSGQFRNNSVRNGFFLAPEGGQSFKSGTRITVYGINGS